MNRQKFFKAFKNPVADARTSKVLVNPEHPDCVIRRLEVEKDSKVVFFMYRSFRTVFFITNKMVGCGA